MEAKMKSNQALRDRPQGLQEIYSAWNTLQDHVVLGQIRTEKQYRNMVAIADKLIDEIGGDERHPLSTLLEVVAALIEQYESESAPFEDAEPRSVLGLLMEQHDLKQADLAKEIGSQGVVSEILNGKREINARQAKALAQRFGVSASVFV